MRRVFSNLPQTFRGRINAANWDEDLIQWLAIPPFRPVPNLGPISAQNNYFTGERLTDLMVDLSADRITDLIIDFIADEPFLLTITLLTISFSFLSPNLSSDVTANAMSDFVGIFRFLLILGAFVFWLLRELLFWGGQA